MCGVRSGRRRSPGRCPIASARCIAIAACFMRVVADHFLNSSGEASWPSTSFGGSRAARRRVAAIPRTTRIDPTHAELVPTALRLERGVGGAGAGMMHHRRASRKHQVVRCALHEQRRDRLTVGSTSLWMIARQPASRAASSNIAIVPIRYSLPAIGIRLPNPMKTGAGPLARNASTAGESVFVLVWRQFEKAAQLMPRRPIIRAIEQRRTRADQVQPMRRPAVIQEIFERRQAHLGAKAVHVLEQGQVERESRQLPLDSVAPFAKPRRSVADGSCATGSASCANWTVMVGTLARSAAARAGCRMKW